ncbi:hypothetical protein N7537_010347 [Penicillium hordei]|uniref:Uncharacterized protein n=1 Tax=Penicillium hordei TaxID=40994 RepID=A0AAD6GWL7_9EURO|nr:uncharacterized protein N7537_010347 [Penicillium hordei]KAJ5593443.1 hypothetical protein N7537_010347 [Penicillium hordei]
MRLLRPIPFVLALILLPALAASIDADPSRPCGSNEICRYTTDYEMEDFPVRENECTCSENIHYHTCQQA